MPKKSTSTSGRKPAAAPRGALSVAEAGRMGGIKGGRKGGNAVKAKYGDEFYRQIGKKGGAKVKELIAAGKAALEKKKK